MSSRFVSVLLKIGGLGCFLGFASWTTWGALASLSFFGILTFDDSRVMSGIFFQAPSYRLIFYFLLSCSLFFSGVGCFAMSKKRNSVLGFVSGVFFVVAFLCAIPYGLSFAVFEYYATYVLFLFPLLFFSGLILWGATLLIIARKIGVSNRGRAAGVLFVVSGTFGMLLWQVILYWGFEFWLLSFGWMYAIGALISTMVFFKLSGSQTRARGLL